MAAGSSKKKVIYANSTPAGELREREFTLRHPLLQVNEGPVTKFQDGKKLDPKVCDYFLQEVMMQMDDFGDCYAVGGVPISQELHYRPVACALLPVFTRLAPKAGELLEGEDPKYHREDTAAGFQQTGTDLVMEDEAGNLMTASMMSDGSDLSGWSFSDGCFRHEDGSALKPHEAVDCRGYVMDMNLRDRVARSVFEMKANQLWPVTLHQGLYYGAGAAIENVRVGRFKKVYVVVMGIGWAGVAEIDPIGFLTVTDKNVISSDTAANFRKQVHGKCAYLESKGKQDESQKLKMLYCCESETVEQLAGRLQEEARDTMEKEVMFLNASDKKTTYSATFPDSTSILVGSATYRSEPYTILRYPLKNMVDLTLREDRIVVSGIARIVYGDRALKWKLPQLEKLAQERREAKVQRVRKIMALF